jgi:hypothetical protein
VGQTGETVIDKYRWKDVVPGTSVRVVAGIRHDWLQQMDNWERWPWLPERECLVTAIVLRVHRPKEKENIWK